MRKSAPKIYGIKSSLWLYFLITFWFVAIWFMPAMSTAQVPLFDTPPSINPVGSGARALGMGGAFIAVADDATAASWNPGGLIQLETPEVSVVGAYCQRKDDLNFGTNPEASGNQSVTNPNINYLSAAYPFTLLNRNMIVSASHQHLYNFYREWDFSIGINELGNSSSQDICIDQNGSLSAIGLSYCIQVTPGFSFGFTMNFWQDGLYNNQWESKTSQSGSGNYLGNTYSFSADTTHKYSFRGFNANFGIL